VIDDGLKGRVDKSKKCRYPFNFIKIQKSKNNYLIYKNLKIQKNFSDLNDKNQKTFQFSANIGFDFNI